MTVSTGKRKYRLPRTWADYHQIIAPRMGSSLKQDQRRPSDGGKWTGWESARPLREVYGERSGLVGSLATGSRDPSQIVSSRWVIDIAAPNRRCSQVSMPTSEASAGAVGLVISINRRQPQCTQGECQLEQHRHKLWAPAMLISTRPVAQAAHDVGIVHCTICKKLITLDHFGIPGL